MRPGEYVSATFEQSVSSDSGGGLTNFRLGFEGNEFTHFISSRSEMGPVEIPIGGTKTFKVYFDVDSRAPFGCTRIWVTQTCDDAAIIDPDPEDDPIPIDLAVLPSTGTPGRPWQKFRAALSCRSRLRASEKPGLLVLCRRRIQALASQPHAETLWFVESDRTRRELSLSEVIAEAETGNVPAILELGYRPGGLARTTLRTLSGASRTERFIGAMNDGGVYECVVRPEEFASRLGREKQAALQALARLGDENAFARSIEGLGSVNPAQVEAAVAALAYIGGPRASQSLAIRLLAAAPGDPARYSVVRALEAVEPQEASRIRAGNASIEGQLVAWYDWARKTSQKR